MAVIIAAAVLANLSFISRRPFGVLPRRTLKSAWLHVSELGAAYLVFLYFCLWMERAEHGVAYSQGWEFYAASLCVFLVFGFPGFVFRFFVSR